MNFLLITQVFSYSLCCAQYLLVYCPWLRKHVLGSKYNIFYIRLLSYLKSKNHLHNYHVSLFIDTYDLSKWNSHVGKFSVHIIWQTPTY
jgi:hypothetical protein